MELEPRTSEVYAAYRAELNAERMTNHVREGTRVALLLQTAFIALDWFAFPELFSFCLSVRLALNVLLAVIYFRTSFTHPVASEVALCLVMGIGMLMLVYATNAPESRYYAGLILVFVGMGVILPLTASQSAGICGPLLAGYFVSPMFSPGPIPWGTFGLHSVFLSAAAVESVVSCAFLDRVRLTDFSQRRAIEKARDDLKELDEQKARFSANVHHELRTPLTLMLAPLEAIRSGDYGELPPSLPPVLQSMYANGKRLLKLINNLLDMAKLESQEFCIRRRPIDLAELIEEVVDGARSLAERKRIRMEMEPFRGSRVVNADPDAVEKVVVNLVGNALKFTDAGGRISVSGQETPEGGLRVSVVDTGIGIPADQLGKVFDRFAQVDASTTRRHEGTGIGLSLARELIELHGGKIWAESEGLGHGAAMIFELPPGEIDRDADEEVVSRGDGRALGARESIQAVEAELDFDGHEPVVGDRGAGGDGAGELVEIERSVERWEGDRAEPEAVAGHSGDGPEILVAEDNRDMRRLLAFLLGREFRVRAARNGREALEMLREERPDLVLTDVMMPEMSGTELCAAIKGDPETSGIPVVIVTSKAEREMKIQGLELGADDYVTKPFHPRELLARVRSLVRLRRIQEELADRNRELEQAMAELKQAEAQLVHSERLAAVGEMAAGVAHEVNNPVNFALNSARALRSAVRELAELAGLVAALDWKDREKLAEQVEELQQRQQEIGVEELAASLEELSGIVADGLDRTRRLVGDLRDFAAPGSGQRVVVDVAKGLRSTVQLLGHDFSTRGARVELRVPEGLPRLQGDAGALNQVFLNLLKNAAEAMEEGGGGAIRVEASVVGETLTITFQDEGPGMTPAVREKLFEPFFTTKAAGRGTGLGLSISRQIVQAHGGALTVETAPGEGTTFRVTLPLEAATGGEPARDGDGADEPPRTPGGEGERAA